MELHELNAPADIINLLGWWARDAAPGKGTRAYYNSIHIGKMLMVTAHLGQSLTHHPAPGVYTGRPARPVDWTAVWVSYERGLPVRPPAIRQPALLASMAEADHEADSGTDEDPSPDRHPRPANHRFS